MDNIAFFLQFTKLSVHWRRPLPCRTVISISQPAAFFPFPCSWAAGRVWGISHVSHLGRGEGAVSLYFVLSLLCAPLSIPHGAVVRGLLACPKLLILFFFSVFPVHLLFLFLSFFLSFLLSALPYVLVGYITIFVARNWPVSKIFFWPSLSS